MQSPELLHLWQAAERHLAAGNLAAANGAYGQLLGDARFGPLAHLRLSLVATGQQRYRDAVEQALQAFAKRTPDVDLLAMLAKRLAVLGETRAALDCALEPIMMQADGATLAGIGRSLSDASCPVEARQLLQRACQRGGDSPGVRYLLGLNRLYSEGGSAAVEELEAVADAQPDMAVALWALSKAPAGQAGAQSRIGRIQAAIARRQPGADDQPLLHYALFNELDRDGQAEPAWQALDAGMRARRAQVRFDADAEQALFDQLGGARPPPAPALGHVDDGPRPVFIVGLPGADRTLLEPILGNHPDVADAGELRDFMRQLRWTCDLGGPAQLDLALARRAESIDFAELGRRYLAHTQWRAQGRAVYVDRMPDNFLAVSHIARALPQARILHLVRGPMDTCFSNLSELFAGAYPHSYDQLEMADHFRRYRTLMAHWRALYPERILDVRQDELLAEPGRVAREVLEFCGLPWHAGADVAEPARAAGDERGARQWRRYETHLGPLRERLGALAY